MKHILQNNCLPKSDGILTYVIQKYNYSQFEYKICKNNTNIMLSNWMKICREPCVEVIYEPIISNSKQVRYYTYYELLIRPQIVRSYIQRVSP